VASSPHVKGSDAGPAAGDCHSAVLATGNTYFVDRLSDSWPTCQILGLRYSVEVYYQELDLSSNINVLVGNWPSAGAQVCSSNIWRQLGVTGERRHRRPRLERRVTAQAGSDGADGLNRQRTDKTGTF
jgi:hypothetical protein